MAAINIDSILKKAEQHMQTPAGQRKINDTVTKAMVGHVRLQVSGIIHSPEEAASKFIEVLRHNIEGAGLSSGAIAAISNIENGSAHSLGNNTYLVHVYFTGDISRPSLDEERYGGIDDIVALFNNGVDHTMKPVYGMWHGKETWSRTIIPGTHFIEQSIRDFMGNYATEYNVIDISVQGL